MDTNETKPESNVDRLRREIEEKRAAKRVPAEEVARQREERYLAAYLKALDQHEEAELVIVDVPRVGKCILKFAARPEHAKFTREIHERVEVPPCLTFSVRCAVFPPPDQFRRELEEKNPEGFVTCAMAVKSAMAGKVDEEGKD